jgi:hypothetical protein
MTPAADRRLLHHPAAWLAAVIMAASSPVALAANLSGNVTVNLIAPGGLTSDGGATIDPTPVSLSDTVTVSAGAIELSAGDSTTIGSQLMLTSPTPIGSSIPLYAPVSSELIDFNGSSIFVRLLTGSASALNVYTTGYLGSGGTHARYEFTGLNVPGETITGLSYLVGDNFGTLANTGLVNPPANFIRLTSAHSIVFELDQLQFADRGQGNASNYAEFRIDLQTAPVPEPSTFALALLGLGLTAWTARRRTTA